MLDSKSSIDLIAQVDEGAVQDMLHQCLCNSRDHLGAELLIKCFSCCNKVTAPLTLVSAEVRTRTKFGREIDIRVEIIDAIGKRGVALIEVKIDAEFTLNQPEAYRAYAEHLLANEFDFAVTVLVAPHKYIRGHLCASFDASITFEQIAELDRRYGNHACADFLECAMTKIYVQEPDAVNTAFWQDYEVLKNSVYPHLAITNMPPDGKPKQAIDVYFQSAVPRWPVKHSLKNGRVMIELLGRGHFLNVIEPAIRRFLSTKMTLGFPPKGRNRGGGRGSSLHIAVAVPPVDSFEDFARQRVQILEGLKAVSALWDWTASHKTFLVDLNERIQQADA